MTTAWLLRNPISLFSHPPHVTMISNRLLEKPHGRAFKVLKKDELVHDVIPSYFDCAKYESFTRQLTAWDFRRCKRGPGTLSAAEVDLLQQQRAFKAETNLHIEPCCRSRLLLSRGVFERVAGADLFHSTDATTLQEERSKDHRTRRRAR